MNKLSITTLPSSSVDASEGFHVSVFTEQVDSTRKVVSVPANGELCRMVTFIDGI